LDDVDDWESGAGAAAAAPPPVAQQPIAQIEFNGNFRRGRGRPRGMAGAAARGRGRGSGAVAAQTAAVDRGPLDWHPVDFPALFVPPTFKGSPGAADFRDRETRANWDTVKTSKLYFFEKFIDGWFRDVVVRETNKYVAEIPTKRRPATLAARYPWPPKWVEKFPKFTEAKFMRWLAFLLWMGLHKTASEEELFSTHWIWRRPAVNAFFSRDEHRHIKAALHCQDDDQMVARGITDVEGRPVIRKIGQLMDYIAKKCRELYSPGPDIAHDEISVQCSGRTCLKKQLRIKPIGAGIQFMAFAESNNSKHYICDFELDRNDGEPGKIRKNLLRLVKRLPAGSRGYRIAADNLFNSPDVCKEVEQLGHGIYGTLRSHRGITPQMQEIAKTLTKKGDHAFQISADASTVIWAWHDSKVCFGITNIHPVACLICHRRMKGRADGVYFPCPLMFSEYNKWMGAIDDFDRLLSFHSCKLKSNKWWHTIFFFLIDVASVNGLHLWRLANPDDAHIISRRVWIAGLIEEILEKYGTKDGRKLADMHLWQAADVEPFRPDENPGGRGGSHHGLANARDVLAGEERTSGRHFPGKGKPRGNCALCYWCLPKKGGEKQVVWHCEQCNVMLHVPECFKEWHTKRNPKSPFV